MSADNKDDFLFAAKEAQEKQKRKLFLYLSILSISLIIGFFLFMLSSSISDNSSFDEGVSQKEVAKNLDCLSQDKDTDFCKTRLSAINLISNLDKIINNLETKNVKIWNFESFEKLIKSFDIANRSFNAERYLKAYEELIIAENLAKKLSNQADDILNQGLELGLEFLNLGKIDKALERFKEAQLIEPNNPLVQEGLKRSYVFDEIVLELNEAKNLVDNQFLDEAYLKINNAYQKDKKNIKSNEALKEINFLIKERNFSLAMKAGNLAINNLNPSIGIPAFTDALSIKPNSELAKIGLERILAINKSIKINSLLKDSIELEKKEDWNSALSGYKNILSLDKNIEIAQDGDLRTSDILQAKTMIDNYLNNPNRAADFNIRNDVKKTINNGLRVIEEYNPGSKFSTSLKELIELISALEKPIAVNFISDNKTKISITRVGVFGPFKEDFIYLKPGRYEIIGMRSGYKEKRLVINIDAKKNNIIKIICNESI